MTGVGPVTVLPLATGMSLTLTLLALRGERRAELAREDAAAAAAAEAAGAAAAAVAEVPAAEAPIAAAESAGTQAATSAANGVAAGSGAQADGGAGLPAADPDVVVWSRVDQKTCLKAVTAAGLTPHVVQLRRQGDQLVTDMEVRSGWGGALPAGQGGGGALCGCLQARTRAGRFCHREARWCKARWYLA